MSLKLDEINAAMSDIGIPLAERQKIMKSLEQTELDKKEERQSEKLPKSKKKWCVLIRGDSSLQAQLTGGARIIQVAQDRDVNTILADFSKIKNQHNGSIKKQSLKVTDWVSFFSKIKAKFLTASGIWNKSKGEIAEIVILSGENVP